MDVCSIDTYFNHITGVRLDDGSHVSADYIVSNREVIPTYRDLLHFSNKKIAQLEKVYGPAHLLCNAFRSRQRICSTGTS